MQVQPINNNNQTFGIRYLNKSAWSKVVLKAFEESDVLRSIDQKYPAAQINYTKFNWSDIANDEPITTALLSLRLNEKKAYTLQRDSHNPSVPDRLICDEIKNLTIGQIEKEAHDANKPNPVIKIEITGVKKENPVLAFFKKIFS